VGGSLTENVIRFGLFELDLKSGQLRKNGSRIRISQQPVQVLALLLERPGEVVTREELRQRLWSPDTFVDFDHGLNKSVQKLRDALGDSAESPRFIETIPRVGYRFIAPVKEGVRPGIQEPDEQTGKHFAPEPIRDRSASISQIKLRINSVWLLLAGCVAVLLIGAGWLALRKQERERQRAPILSLAVLPLDNLSGGHEQDYFADGMTDELTTMLAKNSTLRIVSRTSAMQYKGASRPLREIAQALGVDGVVEGSVERSGNKVHMTLQLIQGPSDTHVWAESYDRDANNMASLLDEAAMAIAKKTNSAVAERAPARYVNPEARDAYMRGEHFWYSENSSEKAKNYFEKAVELQPDYASGWLGLSQYYGSSLLNGRVNPKDALAPMEAAAQKAVELEARFQTHILRFVDRSFSESVTGRAPTGSAFAQSIWIRDIRLHIICARGFSPQSIVMMKAFRKRRLPPSSIHPATSGGWPVLICGRESTTWASLKRACALNPVHATGGR